MSGADWSRAESDVVVAQMFSSFLRMQETSVEVGIKNKQQAHLAYVILWQQNSDIFFSFFVHRPRPTRCLSKSCAFSQDDVQCNKKAFPYTKFCKNRIFL